MESLRKFLKKNRERTVTVTTSKDVYYGKGEKIKKMVSLDELKEIVVDEYEDIFDELLYAETDVVEEE